MSTDDGSYGDPETRERILTVTGDLIASRGARLKLSEVAQHAGVSRQAVYLHFGDRNGLLVALVQHIDETLDLDRSLANVLAATTGAELLKRTMRLNHDFWTAVQPIAQVLEAAQYDDEALGAAWRDRMQFRQAAFRMMVQRIADIGDLAPQWDIEEASDLLYGVAHFDTWRELTRHVGWTDDHYVDAMVRLLCRSLLVT